MRKSKFPKNIDIDYQVNEILNKSGLFDEKKHEEPEAVTEYVTIKDYRGLFKVIPVCAAMVAALAIIVAIDNYKPTSKIPNGAPLAAGDETQESRGLITISTTAEAWNNTQSVSQSLPRKEITNGNYTFLSDVTIFKKDGSDGENIVTETIAKSQSNPNDALKIYQNKNDTSNDILYARFKNLDELYYKGKSYTQLKYLFNNSIESERVDRVNSLISNKDYINVDKLLKPVNYIEFAEADISTMPDNTERAVIKISQLYDFYTLNGNDEEEYRYIERCYVKNYQLYNQLEITDVSEILGFTSNTQLQEFIRTFIDTVKTNYGVQLSWSEAESFLYENNTVYRDNNYAYVICNDVEWNVKPNAQKEYVNSSFVTVKILL